MNRKLLLPAVVLTGAAFLGACSSDHSGMDMGDGAMNGAVQMEDSAAMAAMSTIPADADFNATDVAFARGMVVHHAQAIEMSDMALERDVSPQLAAKATKIKAAQAPEIELMSSWLAAWGMPEPDTSMGMDHSMDGDMGDDRAMGDMSDDGMMMSGMMTEEDMTRLETAQGTAFEREFYEQMIVHHRGALEMAQQQLDGGKYAPAMALSQTIIDTQTAEIAEMEALLAALS